MTGKTSMWRRLVAVVPMTAMPGLMLAPIAQAEMIGAAPVVDAADRSAEIEQFDAFMARDEVRDQLLAYGVTPEQAQARVQSMTTAELAELNGRIDQLPAGAGALEVIGIVFLVLLILEVTGIINVFHG